MGLLLDILSGLGGGWDHFRARQPRPDTTRQQMRDQRAWRGMERQHEDFRRDWNNVRRTHGWPGEDDGYGWHW